jgi:hypothetical protein
MRSKSKPVGDETQMDLFGWVDKAPRNPAAKANRSDTQHEIGATGRRSSVTACVIRKKRSVRLLGYDEWKRSVAKHMWDDWYVKMEEAVEGMEVVDEGMLRAAHKKGVEPTHFVRDLAYACDWINFGPWR